MCHGKLRLPLSIRSSEKAAVLLSLLLFLALSSPQLALPGLNYDEALDAVPAMQLLLGQPVETIRGSGLRVADRTFPLMVMDYKGVVHTYWALPFLWALGVNVFALRLSCLFLSLLTLALTYRCARQPYGPQVAVMTSLLLAVSPSFVFWSRQGVLWTTAMLTCGMGALAAVGDWRRRGQSWKLWWGAFLLGLGLSAKAAFFWFPVALVLSAAILEAARGQAAWRHLTRVRESSALQVRSARLVSGGLLAFLLGLLPLLLYNLQTGGTLRVVRDNLHTSYYGVNNLDYLANLRIRWDHMHALLDGSSFWYLGGVQRDLFFPLAFWASAGITLAYGLYAVVSRYAPLKRHCPGNPPARCAGHRACLHGTSNARKEPRHATAVSTSGGEGASMDKYALFPLLMMALIGLQSGATVSGLWPEHYLLLLPFPQLGIATGLELLRRHVHLRGTAASLVILATAVLTAGQLRVDLQYHHVLARRGGFSAHSDAVYRLVQYLESRDRTLVSMDWGIRAPVQFLTQGQINPVERFGFQSLDQPSANFAMDLAPYLADQDTLYIFHSPEETIYQGRQAALEGLLHQRGLVLDEKRTIYDRSARPVFVVMGADEE